MIPWTRVVTHPLGLIGFALFLVFSFLAKNRQKKKPAWLAPFAYGMAFVTLVGGFGLAYIQTGRPTSKDGGSYQTIGAIQQNSSGASNSNVAGVQGNVSVTIAPPNQDNRSNGDPLTQEDLITLLRTKATSERVVAEIERRGIAFDMTSDRAKELSAAGATQGILDALERNGKK
jgi:hypothetical protein